MWSRNRACASGNLAGIRDILRSPAEISVQSDTKSVTEPRAAIAGGR